MNSNPDKKRADITDLSNLKTRLCKNIGQCAFGDSCHYAHSLSQIIVVSCAYDNECIFIYNHEDGGCLNANHSKICFFKHPNETTEQYHKRVGNIKPPPPPPQPSKVINPIKINLHEREEWSTVVHKKKNTLNLQSVAELYVKHDDVNIISKVEEMIKKKTSKITLIVDYS